MSIKHVSIAMDSVGDEPAAYSAQFIHLLAEYHERQAKELEPILSGPTLKSVEGIYRASRLVDRMREDGAIEAWRVIRKEIPFFKRLTVSRNPDRELVESYVESQRLRAIADFNKLLAKED